MKCELFYVLIFFSITFFERNLNHDSYLNNIRYILSFKTEMYFNAF